MEDDKYYTNGNLTFCFEVRLSNYGGDKATIIKNVMAHLEELSIIYDIKYANAACWLDDDDTTDERGDWLKYQERENYYESTREK